MPKLRRRGLEQSKDVTQQQRETESRKLQNDCLEMFLKSNLEHHNMVNSFLGYSGGTVYKKTAE